MKKNNHTYYENVKPKRGRKVLISLTSALAVVVFGVGVAFANGGVPEIFDWVFQPLDATTAISLTGGDGAVGTSVVGGKGGHGGSAATIGNGACKNGLDTDITNGELGTYTSGGSVTNAGAVGSKGSGKNFDKGYPGDCTPNGTSGSTQRYGGSTGGTGGKGGTSSTAPTNRNGGDAIERADGCGSMCIVGGGGGGGGGAFSGNGADGAAGTSYTTTTYTDTEYPSITLKGGNGGNGGDSTGGTGGDGGTGGNVMYLQSVTPRVYSGGGGGAGGNGGNAGKGGNGGAGGAVTATLKGDNNSNKIVKINGASTVESGTQGTKDGTATDGSDGSKGADGSTFTNNNSGANSWTRYAASTTCGIGGLRTDNAFQYGAGGCKGTGGSGGTAGTKGAGGTATLNAGANTFVQLPNVAAALTFKSNTGGTVVADVKNVVVAGTGTNPGIKFDGAGTTAANVVIENAWIYPGRTLNASRTSSTGAIKITNTHKLRYYNDGGTLQTAGATSYGTGVTATNNGDPIDMLKAPDLSNANQTSGKIGATTYDLKGPYGPASNYILQCAIDPTFTNDVFTDSSTSAGARTISGLHTNGTYNCRYSTTVNYGASGGATTVYSETKTVAIDGIDPLLHYVNAKGVVLNDNGTETGFVPSGEVLYDSTTNSCSGPKNLTDICGLATTTTGVKLYGTSAEFITGEYDELYSPDAISLGEGHTIEGFNETNFLSEVLENYIQISPDKVLGSGIAVDNYGKYDQTAGAKSVTVYYLPKPDRNITLTWKNDPSITITPSAENAASLDCPTGIDTDRAYHCSFGFGQSFKFSATLGNGFEKGANYKVYYRYVAQSGTARVGRSATVRTITPRSGSPLESTPPADALEASLVGGDDWEIHGITGDIEIFALGALYEKAQDTGTITIHKMKNSPMISKSYDVTTGTGADVTDINEDSLINNHGLESTDASGLGYLPVNGARFAVLSIPKADAISEFAWDDSQGGPALNADGTSAIDYAKAIKYAHKIAAQQATNRGNPTVTFAADTDENVSSAHGEAGSSKIRILNTELGIAKFNVNDLSTENLNDNLFMVIEIVAAANEYYTNDDAWNTALGDDGFEKGVFPNGLENTVSSPVIVNVPNYNYAENLEPLDDLNYDIHIYPKNLALSANVQFNKYAFTKDNELRPVVGALFDIYRANVKTDAEDNGTQIDGDFDGTWSLVPGKQGYSDQNGVVKIPGPFDGVYKAVEVALVRDQAGLMALFGEDWVPLGSANQQKYIDAVAPNATLLPNAHEFLFAIGDAEITGSPAGTYIPVEDLNIHVDQTNLTGTWINSTLEPIQEQDTAYVNAVTAALAGSTGELKDKYVPEPETAPETIKTEACSLAMSGVKNHCEAAFYDFTQPEALISIPPTVDFGEKFETTVQAGIPWDIATYKNYTITLPVDGSKFGEPTDVQVNGGTLAGVTTSVDDTTGTITITLDPTQADLVNLKGTTVPITFKLTLNPEITEGTKTPLHTPHQLDASLTFSNSFDYEEAHANLFSTDGVGATGILDASDAPVPSRSVTGITPDPSLFNTFNIVSNAGSAATITGGEQWIKVDSENTAYALEGAKFVISKTDGGSPAKTEYMKRDPDGNISWKVAANMDALKALITADEVSVLVSGDLDGDGIPDSNPQPSAADGVLVADDVKTVRSDVGVGTSGFFNVAGLAYSIVPAYDYTTPNAAAFAGWVDNRDQTVVTDEAGFALSNNRSYALVEVNAPAGYQLLTEPLKFNIEHKTDVNSIYADGIPEREVKNAVFSTLPITGGFGVFLIIIFTLLMIGGVIIFRRGQKRSNA